ncbi:MAG TPA: HEAT repeat domain-containing protein [Kofleriaceae bacterium]|nr:HEAT repeat domain-containing protein [Kofleriaceae bacterium]
MTYTEAVALLRASDTTCRGADALARLGNKAALAPLLDAHSSAEDAATKQCVKLAMEALGARQEARVLAGSPASGDRHLGVTLMGMFRDDAHLSVLAALIDGDADAAVRAHAIDVLWLQKRTGPWESTMLKALDHRDTAVRGTAAQALTGQYGAAVLAALRKRLTIEKEPSVRARLEAAIREHESHAARKK